MAGLAKRYNVPVLYYISPQVWAWRTGRVKKIAHRVDRMAVILPFEEDFYRERGVDVEYVGHPLLDSIPQDLDRDEIIIPYTAPLLARYRLLKQRLAEIEDLQGLDLVRRLWDPEDDDTLDIRLLAGRVA